MAETAADVLVESILDWGVDTVFGLPGDGINGIWKRCEPGRIACASFKCVTKKPPPSWLALMRNTQDDLVVVSPLLGQVAFIC